MINKRCYFDLSRSELIFIFGLGRIFVILTHFLHEHLFFDRNLLRICLIFNHFSYEESKPLARYADDQDLAVYQKSIKRLDDPMEKYFREKAEKRRKKAGGMPIYKGSWDQNRYNVRPGYRWDGVDRGNGFEKRYFRSLNAKKALKEYEIQYLTEDM